MEPQTSTFQAIGEEDDSQERIQELEEELSRIKADWKENENKVRDECCNEWIEIVTRMEKSWNERYEDFKARYEEFFKNRVDPMATLVRDECCKEWTEVGKGRWKLETKMEKSWNERYEDLKARSYEEFLKNRNDLDQILQDSNQHLQEQLEKLKDSLKASEESKGNLQKEMTRLQFEAAAVASKPKINFCGPEVEDEEDVDIVQQENERLLKELEQTKETLSDVQAKLEQSNLLLTDANERLNVREEELVNLEEKLMKDVLKFLTE